MCKTWHVAPDAPNDGNGSLERPWLLGHALAGADGDIAPGDTVLLRGGGYLAYAGYNVRIGGAPGRPITFAAYPGETPLIDGGRPEFRRPDQPAWRSVSIPGSGNVYETIDQFENPSTFPWFGGLIQLNGEPPWTWYPLAVHNDLTYLQSDIHVWRDAPRYLGPGLAYDAASRRIHIRLDNSSDEAQGGRPDVAQIGNPDPNQHQLLINANHHVGFRIFGSHLRFTRLRFRGHHTCWVLAGAPTNIRFVECTGEPYYFVGRLAGGTDVKILGGSYDGHMHSPAWWVSYSDIKGSAHPDEQPPADRMRKCAFDLGASSDVELGPSPSGERMVIRQFFDGILATGPLRDIAVHGVWFDEIWDDAWQQMPNISDVDYYDNVHFGAGPSRNGKHVEPSGTVYIHDNVVDTTVRPIFWYRIGREETPAIRESIAFSGHAPNAADFPVFPWKLYYNTMVTGRAPSGGGLTTGQFGASTAPGQPPHEVYNNIFVVHDGQHLLRRANADSGLEVYDGDCLWSGDAWRQKNGPYRELIAAANSLNPAQRPELRTLQGLKESEVPDASSTNGRPRWYASSIETDPRLDSSYRPTAFSLNWGAANISGRGWPGARFYRRRRGARLTAPFPVARTPVPRLTDRTAEYDTPPAIGAPTGWTTPELGIAILGYRDTRGHIHELWRDPRRTGTTDLTANAGAPLAAGDPFGYLDPLTTTQVVLYRGTDTDVHGLHWQLGAVGHDNLTESAGAPMAAGDPVGWISCSDGINHAVYRNTTGHLTELWWTESDPADHRELSRVAGARLAEGDPAAFFDTARDENVVVYRSIDGHIRSLYWTTGAVRHEDLSGFAGTPDAASDPVAFYTGHDDTHQVIYRGLDGHLYELYWQGTVPVVGWDLTELSGAPDAVGTPAAYYSAGTHIKRVAFRSADRRVHEISWVPGGGLPAHRDLSAFAGAPSAVAGPVAFTLAGSETQHVAYRDRAGHIQEIRW